MAVKLKLKRLGRRHVPYYRLAAMDTRTRRDGRVLEELGTYDPAAKATGTLVSLEVERIRHWLEQGAQPTPTVANLLKSDEGLKKLMHEKRVQQVARVRAGRKRSSAKAAGTK